MWRSLGKFFKTPKGLLTLILVILAAMAAQREGLRAVLPGLLSAAIIAGVADMAILRIRKKSWEFPGGAVLTTLIVAMVLQAQEPWFVVTITSVTAILSKYLFRSRFANVFNPAALAIVLSYYMFHTGQSWWGALPELTLYAQPVLVVAGLFITDRVNKMPLICRRSAPGCRDIPASGSGSGALFRVYHPDRPSDDPRQISRSDRLRRNRGSRQLRVLRMGGRSLLPAGRHAGGQCMGVVASCEPPIGLYVPPRYQRLPA
jgi:hypothetical protein